mgnify:CR=1 FL=1
MGTYFKAIDRFAAALTRGVIRHRGLVPGHAELDLALQVLAERACQPQHARRGRRVGGPAALPTRPALLVGVAHALMIHPRQHAEEGLADLPQVGERKFGVVQLVVVPPLLYDLVDLRLGRPPPPWRKIGLDRNIP